MATDTSLALPAGKAVQQTQIGGGLFGRRCAEVRRRQRRQMLGKPRLVRFRAKQFANRRATPIEHRVDGGFGAVAGQMLHRAVVEIGHDFRLPAVPHVRPDRSQIGRRQNVEHLQQLGRADLHGQLNRQLLVGRVAAKRQMVQVHVLVNEEPQDLGFVRRKPQPRGRVGGDLQPHFAMILQTPLAEVVDQQRQMQQMLLRNRPVDSAHRPGVRRKLRGELHRPQAVLVDRVLVILIELQQSPGVLELGNEPFEQAGAVQVAQQRRQAARGWAKQRKEMATRLGRRRRRGKLRGLVPNRLPGRGGDRHIVEIRQIDQPHDGRQVSVQHSQAAAVASNPAGPT